jgi:peptide/nickel transport system permease protein
VISVRLNVGGAILALLAAMACSGAMLAPEAYLRMDVAARFAGPDMAHWLGRDELGRDMLSRLLAAATTTVSEALVVVAVALWVGLLLDLTRRAFPRFGIILVALARTCFIAPGFLLGFSRAGNIAMAALSAALLLPGFIAVIAAVAYLGPGPASGTVALGMLFAVAVAYSQAITDRSLQNGAAVATREPATPRARLAAALFAWAILSVSALDATGLSAMPPRPSWGTMLGGLHGLASPRGPTILAAACLVLAAMAALMLADALRDPLPGGARDEASVPS